MISTSVVILAGVGLGLSATAEEYLSRFERSDLIQGTGLNDADTPAFQVSPERHVSR